MNQIRLIVFHNVAYSDSKNLAKRTVSDKILKDKANDIVIIPKHDGQQRRLVNMVYKTFDNKTGLAASINKEVSEELHKLVIKKIKRRKVCARFKDTIWPACLAEMRSLFSFNRNVNYLLCVIDVFTKYAWVTLKDKKTKAVLHDFMEMETQSKRKPDRLQVDQGKEFCNRFMQKWLNDNDISMYSIHNESKSVDAERFVKTPKGKTYKK